MGNTETNKYKRKMMVFIVLDVCLLLVLLIVVFIWILPHYMKDDSYESQEQPEFVDSDFIYVEEPYDIRPGNDCILYTNYACPYCALFYERETRDYTIRILLLDKDSDRFQNQNVVSPYMLMLYRKDPESFEDTQDCLFANQDDWVYLSDDALLLYLNQITGENWTIEDLAPALEELVVAEQEAPDDLEFVPALYADNKRYDGYVLGLVG